MSAPKKIYLSKLVMAGAEILDKPVSDDDVEYIRADIIRDGSSEIPNDQPLPEDTVLFKKGVEEGKRLAEEEQADLFTIVALDAAQRAKEQMMKEGLDAVKSGQSNKIEKTIAGVFVKYGMDRQKEQMMDEWLKDRDGCFWDGVEEGKKAMEDAILALIESRISEIIGDAQPKPALRAELEELINRIKNED